jgi:hypothetical protein
VVPGVEDAVRQVPQKITDAAFAMGRTRSLQGEKPSLLRQIAAAEAELAKTKEVEQPAIDRRRVDPVGELVRVRLVAPVDALPLGLLLVAE